MTVNSSFFTKPRSLPFYTGDKQVEIVSCTDGNDRKQPYTAGSGAIAFSIHRGGCVKFTYTAQIGNPAKHGNQGNISEEYIAFDGGHVFLLPAEFYQAKNHFNAGARSLAFSFHFNPDWTSIVPVTEINNPSWNDIYNLRNNGFLFGNFAKLEPLDGQTDFTVYALASDIENYRGQSGFSELYNYYKQLFGSAPERLNVILLPRAGESAPDVLGGSGNATIAASFNAEQLNDWKLLGHRMFHSFFDSAAKDYWYHLPVNLWLYEGLATYYENLSVSALNASLRETIGANPDRQFAVIFAQYLYMKSKHPDFCDIVPMNEPSLVDSPTSIEFLHYTAAPLLVKYFEQLSSENGNLPDALLKYCLKQSGNLDEPILAAGASDALLGSGSTDFFSSYCLSSGIPPLWDLSGFLPDAKDTAESLNYIEALIGSWAVYEDAEYEGSLIDVYALEELMEQAETAKADFADEETMQKIKNYSPVLYASLCR